MTTSAGTRGGPPTEASIAELAELVRQLPEQMSQVAHDEVELVRAEMGELVKQQSEHISQEVELVKAELGELVKQQSEHISQEVALVRAELEPKVAHVETDLELLKQLPDHIRQVAHDEVELVRAEMGELVKQQSEHISQEVELVRAELEPKVAHVETDLELLKQLPDHIRQVAHQEVELVRAELGELVKQQSEHISQEVELVRAELEPKVAHVETDLELLKQLPDQIRQVAHHEVELVRAEMGELAKQQSDHISQVAHQEVALVRAELEAKVKRVEIGLGMFAGAGAIAFYALGVLVATAVLGLATAVTAWLSALIVAVALVAIAGLLVLGGNSKMHESSHRQPS